MPSVENQCLVFTVLTFTDHPHVDRPSYCERIPAGGQLPALTHFHHRTRDLVVELGFTWLMSQKLQSPYLMPSLVYESFVTILLYWVESTNFSWAVAITKHSSDLLQFPKWPELFAFMRTRFRLYFQMCHLCLWMFGGKKVCAYLKRNPVSTFWGICSMQYTVECCSPS